MDSFKPELVKYEILECVGEGLTSSVHKAVRVDSRGHSRQLVALKVLKDESAIPILRREFETLARIRSLHCARVLGWENDGAQAALVLEWIEGATIDRLAKSYALTAAETSEIVRQIAIGLSDLRDQGLHHGDLHPRNVIVDVEGRVRLVDFGTVRSPRPGVIHGVPAYLSPEIWNGETTSFASDFFALGLIEHDMKTRFEEVPKASNAKGRAFRFAKAGGGLLDIAPAQRASSVNFSVSGESSEVCARIGERVRQLLAARVAPTETRLIPLRSSEGAKNWKMPMAASLLAIVCALSISVRAEAPAELDLEPATLEVRSNKWVELEINGKPAGFSPISVHGLRPGLHRLRWRGSAGRGDVRIELFAGRTTRLSEVDLERISAQVNR